MTISMNRRQLLQAAAGTAIAGALATTVGGVAADAAVRPFGSITILRMWGTRTVRRKIPGTSRYRSVRVPRTKGIYDGTAKRTLNLGGLCHWTGTPEPLETGNCVMFGHRTSHGGPLRRSDRMQVGDPIVVTVDGISVTYYVAEIPTVISSNDFTTVLNWGNADKPCLTLVSCSRKDKRPTDVRYRILVRAEAP